jgi:hypothetical protein
MTELFATHLVQLSKFQFDPDFSRAVSPAPSSVTPLSDTAACVYPPLVDLLSLTPISFLLLLFLPTGDMLDYMDAQAAHMKKERWV